MCPPTATQPHGKPGSLTHTTAFNRLSPDLENQFQTDMMFAPGWRDWRKQFIGRVGGPPNTDPGGDYNYRLAWMSGAKPGYDPGSREIHGFTQADYPPFREPVRFKAMNHPTMWKQDFSERFGANPDVVMRQGTATPEMKTYGSDLMRRYMLNRAIGGQ